MRDSLGAVNNKNKTVCLITCYQSLPSIYSINFGIANNLQMFVEVLEVTVPDFFSVLVPMKFFTGMLRQKKKCSTNIYHFFH